MNKLYFDEQPKLFENRLPYELQLLEQEPIITTNQNHEYDGYEPESFSFVNDYLYHGIRFQKYLEKLENIFKERKILAGKYLSNYHFYSDNCNKGKYVSLLKYTSKTELEYETFILENISLLVSPLCNAIETKYVDFGTWNKIQKENYELKHIYSYMQGECMCKDFIPLDMVKAIGIPYQKLRLQGNGAYANKLIEDIKILMEKYDIYLPIVDTSRFNAILYEPNVEEDMIRYIRRNFTIQRRNNNE